MLWFNQELMFVHNPKTGGSAVGAQLPNVLPGIVSVGCTPFGTFHPSLTEALAYVTEHTGSEPSLIMSTLREPVAVMRSWYGYAKSKLHHPRIRAREIERSELILDAIQQSKRLDFNAFIHYLNDTYGSCDIYDSRKFFVHDDRVPDTMAVLRYEQLEQDLRDTLHMRIDLSARVHVTPEKVKTGITVSDETAAIIRSSFSWIRDTLGVDYA